MNIAQSRLTKDRIRDLLHRSWWFADMPAELQLLLLDNGAVRHFVNGQHIIEQGHQAEGIYAILEGQVAFIRQLPETREFLLNVAGVGYWFADPSVLLHEPMPHTVVARSNTRVLFVTARTVNRLRAADARYAVHFSKLHASRFVTAINAVADAAALPREAFLLQRLADLATMMGLSIDKGGDAVEVAVSQGEIAQMIGVSRQTLNGYLSDLQTRGFIEIGYRTLRLHRSLLTHQASLH